MKYIEAAIEGGVVVEKEVIEIDQSKLTSDCWLIQFKGLKACENCEAKDTDECGGKDIRKSLEAELLHRT